MEYMLATLFFMVPVCAVAYWVYSLVKYTKARKAPESCNAEEKKTLKTQLIVSSVVAAVLVAAVAGISVLMYMVVAYM